MLFKQMTAHTVKQAKSIFKKLKPAAGIHLSIVLYILKFDGVYNE